MTEMKSCPVCSQSFDPLQGAYSPTGEVICARCGRNAKMEHSDEERRKKGSVLVGALLGLFVAFFSLFIEHKYVFFLFPLAAVVVAVLTARSALFDRETAEVLGWKKWIVPPLNLLTVLIALVAVSAHFISPYGVDPLDHFEVTRKAHKTKLIDPGPSPQEYEEFPTMPDVSLVRYESGGRKLRGWLLEPGSMALKNEFGVPVLVYLHGGFAAGASDLEDVRQFAERGFAVFLPSFRGENGNPGNFELMLGEVDDAEAAVNWVGAQPELDGSRVYVFGHSAGGSLAGLLALRPNPRHRLSGSANGMYEGSFFDAFELPSEDNDTERAVRLWAPHISQFESGHVACVGKGDAYAMEVMEIVSDEAKEDRKLLRGIIVDGDHMTALPACANAFLDIALKTMN